MDFAELRLGDMLIAKTISTSRIETDTDDKCPLIASHVKGTLAYLPPEFITNKILSTKLDVYSFGIVLLEIGTGMRAYMDSRSPPSLAEYCAITKSSYKGSDWVGLLMDKRTPALENKGTSVAFLFFTDILFFFLDALTWWFDGLIRLGLQCVEKDRLARPPFPEIVKILSELSINFDFTA
ncbi:unnamed protein product [Strongylus vulgaris]|uniref:Protein kinase domain-containing protein n=1 Tax=Strongylus vulgaris TaxID=40348 RepID=A0A3P7KED4_STRVU|nr:unnamed protein product [Strongylus vulgaris]